MQQHITITEGAFTDDTSERRPRRRPIHNTLVSFSAAYFAGALVTDLVYWRMPDVMWERFSIWLILAGVVMAASPSSHTRSTSWAADGSTGRSGRALSATPSPSCSR